MKKTHAWLGVLTWNTHLGRTLTPEVWQWILDFLPKIHVIMFQEVDHRHKVTDLLGDEWAVWPRERVDNNRGTTYVAVRKKRFAQLVGKAKNIRFNSRHSRQVIALETHDKKTGRPTMLGSLHVDPLGKGFEKANPAARFRHVRQVRAWADYAYDWARSWAGKKPVTVIAGDGNERLAEKVNDKLRPSTVMEQLKQVGLQAAWERAVDSGIVDLDDVWFDETGVRLVRRMQFRPRVGDFDHDLVYALLSVKKDKS